MKTISLEKREKFDDRTILRQVCGSHETRGITIAQMRLMLRIMDKLEGDGPLELEDAEYEALKRHFEGYPFAVAHKDLAALADAIDKAV